MKPTRKKQVVSVEFWQCDNPNHRHRSESIAAACFDKTKTDNMPKQNARTLEVQQYSDILKKYREGSSRKDLARELGLSSDKVRQIIGKAVNIEIGEESEDPFISLTIRAGRWLVRGGLNDIDKVRAALDDGSIWGVYGIGRAAVNEVRAWIAEVDSINQTGGMDSAATPAPCQSSRGVLNLGLG